MKLINSNSLTQMKAFEEMVEQLSFEFDSDCNFVNNLEFSDEDVEMMLSLLDEWDSVQKDSKVIDYSKNQEEFMFYIPEPLGDETTEKHSKNLKFRDVTTTFTF